MMWVTYKELYEVKPITREDYPILMEIFQNDSESVNKVFAGWNRYNTNVLIRRKSDLKILGWTEQNRVGNEDGSKVWFVGARAMHPDFRDGGVTAASINAEALYYIFHTWGAKAVYAPVLIATNGNSYNWEDTVPSTVKNTEQKGNYGLVEITREQYLGSI